MHTSSPAQSRCLNVLKSAFPIACWMLGVTGSMAWEPGTYPAASRGFVVDTTDREDVVSFWHGVYQASQGYQNRVGWNGNFLATAPYAGAEGTVSAAFVADVERRVNFYRAMCGLRADIRVNTGSPILITQDDLYKPTQTSLSKAAAAQRAAYMIIRTYNTSLAPGNVAQATSHSPIPANCIAWTDAAWNANANGNISFGFYGPGAIDSYMLEDFEGLSGWNTQVGHRRWLLYSRSTDIATGDTPGSYSPDPLEIRPPSNVLYVSQHPNEMASGVIPTFASYPSAGFFPAPINTKFWSLTYPAANFAGATITMTGPGGVVPLVKKAPVSGFGDNTLVWEVSGAAAARSVAADATYQVTVSGIVIQGVTTSHSYSVTLINPNVPVFSGSLIGTAQPPASAPVSYWFAPGSKMEAVQVNCFQTPVTSWIEGAEDAQPNLMFGSSSGAQFRSPVTYVAPFNTFKAITGAKSYWLSLRKKHDTLTNSVPDDWFELDRDIFPGAGSFLSFKYKRGYMTPATQLRVERSDDGGASWLEIGTPVTGKPDGLPDGAAVSVSIPLPPSTQPARLRFRLSYLGASFGGFYTPEFSGGYDFAAIPVGLFIDDIAISSATWLDLKKTNEPPLQARRFVFDSSSAGGPLAAGSKWVLRKRAKLGNVWLPYQTSLTLTISSTALSGYDAWADYEYPLLNGGFAGDDDGDGIPNGVEFAFSLDPIAPALLQDAIVLDAPGKRLMISRPLPAAHPGITYSAEWSEDLVNWSSAGVNVKMIGGQAEASVQMGDVGRFLRWKISKP